MGYESSHSAARRLQHVARTCRDETLRAELLAALVVPPPFVPPRSTATDMLHHSAASTSADTAPAAPYPWAAAQVPVAETGIVDRRTFHAAPVASADIASAEEAMTPRLPTEGLVAGLATPDVVKSLLDVVAEQARALALVKEAHALGAAALPPEVLAVVAAAAAVLPAALHRGAALPL